MDLGKGIGSLGNWFKKMIDEAPRTPDRNTVQPGVPLPSYQPRQDGGYDVQGLAPGTSVFAQKMGLGVLKNPQSGPVYFDPTGRANDQHQDFVTSAYLAVPMQMPEFQYFEPMKRIGGGY